LVEIHSQDYEGPERRRELIISQCACHLKHEDTLRRHNNAIKGIEEEMKTKINWKLFALFVIVVMGSTGFIYNEIRTTGNTLGARMDNYNNSIKTQINTIDKTLQVSIVRQSMFEASFNEIKEIIRGIKADLHAHQLEVRNNGYKSHKKGEN